MVTASRPQAPTLPRERWFTSEDWWSVILGLFLLAACWAAFVLRAPLTTLGRAKPTAWPAHPLGPHFAETWPAYVAMLAVLTVLTTGAVYVMTGKARNYVLGFLVLFAASTLVMILGAQEQLKTYGLETAFWALVIGLAVGNTIHLPVWFQAAAGRTEFFIKTGIILLGAQLSFNVIIAGGVWGFLEALLIVSAGFTTAFFIAKRMGYDNRFAAVLGAGGSVCGVSAAIAVGGAVKANEKQVGYVISLVVLYALVLIFLLPAISRGIGLSEVVAGAWIGGSELADAAGLASAAMISEKAVQAFTLVKLNRDVMIGFLCFLFAYLAVTRWDVKESGTKPSPRVIWDRFPKFVLAFLVTSIVITALDSSIGPDVATYIVAPLGTIRGWLFTIAFLCIGLNTRIEDVRAMGAKPIIAFTTVVLVNVSVGFILANLFFGGIIAAPLK